MKVTNERKIVKLKEKGITLIALVVTIIILLILAGIAINLALGENGLITKSKLAKEEYDKEALKEEIMLAKVDKEIELSRELNEAEIMDLLEQYGDFVSEEDGTVKFKPNGSSYEIPYEEMKDELGVESSSKIVTITFDSNGGNGNMNKMQKL